MKTLAAVAGAALLIVAAVVVRGALDEDSSGGGAGAGDISVVCPPELADACGMLEADTRVEPVATTAAALSSVEQADALDADVWLAPAAWAGLVTDARDRAGLPALVGEPSAVIARSPVTIVAWSDRAAALEGGACRGPIAWRCLGDVAERPWGPSVGGEGIPGRVEVGLTGPDTAAGLVVLGGAANGYFGGEPYASNDFGGGFSTWLAALGANARSAPASGDVVNDMLTRGRGQYTAVGAIEADARRAADRDDVLVIYPAPVTTADLVAIPLGDPGSDGAANAADAAADLAADGGLRAALADQGWRVAGEPLASGVAAGVELPDGDGLPVGGVLGALAARWNDVTG